MRASWLFGGLMAGSIAFAASVTIEGLKMPILDDAGRMTRRLVASSVSGTLEEPSLRDATVEFFGTDPAATAPNARLALEEAVLIRAQDVVVGTGAMRLTSAKGNMSGRGYRYELTSNILRIRDGFRIELPTAIVEGREADVTIATENGVTVIKEFEARGAIVATARDKTKFDFERATGERAWYAAKDEILHLAPPVRVLAHGRESIMDPKVMEFDLKKRK
jgi:hypothetical protein